MTSNSAYDGWRDPEIHNKYKRGERELQDYWCLQIIDGVVSVWNMCVC